MRILLKERVVYMSSTTKINVPDIFASMVFNDDVMRERLPKDVYKSLRKTIDNGNDLDITVANAVANAMKDWAIEKGATHYTHWFQPMTGITAEKHDSFISPTQTAASSWNSPAKSSSRRAGCFLLPFRRSARNV